MSNEDIEDAVIVSEIANLEEFKKKREEKQRRTEEELEKLENDPNFRKGEVRCSSCATTWAAIAPKGTNYLECPKCKTLNGTWVMPFIKEGAVHWACDCGNTQFMLTENEAYCPNCGKTQPITISVENS